VWRITVIKIVVASYYDGRFVFSLFGGGAIYAHVASSSHVVSTAPTVIKAGDVTAISHLLRLHSESDTCSRSVSRDRWPLLVVNKGQEKFRAIRVAVDCAAILHTLCLVGRDGWVNSLILLFQVTILMAMSLIQLGRLLLLSEVACCC
jgi:hypothetical protein